MKKMSVGLTAALLLAAGVPAEGRSPMGMAVSPAGAKVTSVALAGSPRVGASPTTTSAPNLAAMVLAQTNAVYDDTKLRAYIALVLELITITLDFDARIEAASTEEEAERLRGEMKAAAAAVLWRGEPIGFEEYGEISRAAEADPELQNRIIELIAEIAAEQGITPHPASGADLWQWRWETNDDDVGEGDTSGDGGIVGGNGRK